MNLVITMYNKFSFVSPLYHPNDDNQDNSTDPSDQENCENIENQINQVNQVNHQVDEDMKMMNLWEHFELYRCDPERYKIMVKKNFIFRLICNENNRIYGLVVLMQHLDKKTFIELHEYINLNEMIKACQILDANRRMRKLNYKIKVDNSMITNYKLDNMIDYTITNVGSIMNNVTNMVSSIYDIIKIYSEIPEIVEIPKISELENNSEIENNIETRNKRITEMTDEMENDLFEYQNLEKMTEGIEEIRLTLAKCKMVKGWTKSLSREKLGTWQSDRIKRRWRQLAKMVHLHESKDFQDPLFLARNFTNYY